MDDVFRCGIIIGRASASGLFISSSLARVRESTIRLYGILQTIDVFSFSDFGSETRQYTLFVDPQPGDANIMRLTAMRASWHCMRMTTESEHISLEEFDGLRRFLWNIEAQAAHLAGTADRLGIAVQELPKRPEWTSSAEAQIDAAS